MHTHYQEEKCYEDGIFFYHLGCHQWVSGAELAPPGTPEGEWPICFCQGLLKVTHAPTVMWDFGQKPPGPVWSWPQEAWRHWGQDQGVVAVEMGDIFSSIRSGLQLRFCQFSAIPGNCLQRSAFLKIRQWENAEAEWPFLNNLLYESHHLISLYLSFPLCKL